MMIFFNESLSEAVCTTIKTACDGKYLKLDLPQCDTIQSLAEGETAESRVELDVLYDIDIVAAPEYPGRGNISTIEIFPSEPRRYKRGRRLVNITNFDEMPDR